MRAYDVDPELAEQLRASHEAVEKAKRMVTVEESRFRRLYRKVEKKYTGTFDSHSNRFDEKFEHLVDLFIR